MVCSTHLLLLMWPQDHVTAMLGAAQKLLMPLGIRHSKKILLWSVRNFRTWSRFTHRQYIDPDRTSKTTEMWLCLCMYLRGPAKAWV